jgi:hypothetical protein
MESRRSESAPASVATETMQPAVIKVRPSLLADLNPLVTTAPLARIRKPTRAMISTRAWWPPRVITFVSLEVWSSQVPTAIIQATATMSRAVTSQRWRAVRFDSLMGVRCGGGRSMATTARRRVGTKGTVGRAAEVPAPVR